MDRILFNTDKEMARYVAGEFVLSVEAIQPKINDAVERFIIPMIGEPTLMIATDAYGAEQEMSEHERNLYDRVAKSAIHLALAIGYAGLNVRLTAGGIGVTTGDNMAIASAERVRQYAEERAIDGQIALDELLKYLEANTDEFTEYLESEERRNQRSNFVYSNEVMNQYVMPGVMRWAFNQMKPAITRVEETIIKGVLCKELYDHLKELVIAEVENPDYGVYAPLVPMIQDVVSNLALAASVDRIGLRIDTVHGVYQSFYKNSNEPLQSKQMAGNDLSPIAAQYKIEGNNALEALKKELLTNVDTYVLYKESSCYTAPEENYTRNQIDNGIPGMTNFGF